MNAQNTWKQLSVSVNNRSFIKGSIHTLFSIFFLVYSISGHASTLAWSGDSIIGVNGIVIGNNTYDAYFDERSCESIFSPCTSDSDFQFSSTEASLATMALQTVFDLQGSSFDPLKINGIDQCLGACYVAVPYKVDVSFNRITSAALNVLQTPTSLTSIQSFGTNVEFSNMAFVTFTPAAVTIPASGWLFGAGLLGLLGMTRRKNPNK